MLLTPNFELAEFDCHSGEPVPEQLAPNVKRLCVDVLQRLRDKWGPLVVVSGWRSPEWNKRVGGANLSTHMMGLGADIKTLSPSHLKELISTVEGMIAAGELPGLGGFGKYPGWIHIDIHKSRDGHLRRWDGKGVGSEK